MSFEIRHKDLLGRIGLLHTKRGTVETPLLLPVVNPNAQVIPARQLRDTFGFDALITNSYLVWRRFRNEESVPDIHSLLDFDGVVETDSGAYQILRYGDVEVKPDEIVRFQERLQSDIGIILDVPTGEETSRNRAKWTVNETLRRADEALKVRTNKDMLWVGPVQGGTYPDLVAYSAREMAKRDFSIYALGSPTPVMQQYRYDVLVEMIMAAKANLPPDRPLHLFGGGHPMMFAMAVALGCDVFDSASYALFARNGRYMTPQGTGKLADLEYFPCNCPACHKKTPEEIRRLLPADEERFLASHNLYTCHAELRTVKQAVIDGRLWELVEMRSRTHPALHEAFVRMMDYAEELERETPIRKKKGPFVFSLGSLRRPEVLSHQRRLLERYNPPAGAKKAILIPDTHLKPFLKSEITASSIERIRRKKGTHLCSYGLAFGIVPDELLDVYPLSQTEQALMPTDDIVRHATQRIVSYLRSANYSECVVIAQEPWQLRMAKSIRSKLKRKTRVKLIEVQKEKDLKRLFKKLA